MDEFLQSFPLRPPPDCRVAVLREPVLESGIPDLVIVFWRPDVAKRWTPARWVLTKQDLLILQFLLSSGPIHHRDVIERFGSRSRRSIERLIDARMAREGRGILRAIAPRVTFAIRRIVAIEAKISRSQAVLDQALLNTWFTAESYVLLSSKVVEERFLARAREVGIGVLRPKDTLLRPRAVARTDQPRSYASWLFNEAIIRLALIEGGLE